MLDELKRQRVRWQSAYDGLLQFASNGVFAQELLEAKALFFSKLGRAHEMKEDIFEAVSQSFLEWYLFDYPTKTYGKSPAVVFLTQDRGSIMDREYLIRSLQGPWSLFEVQSKRNGLQVELRDLLFQKTRRVLHDPSQVEHQVWKVEEGQILQARLFSFRPDKPEDDLVENNRFYFLTHIWLHGKNEGEVIKRISERRKNNWGDHKDFLLSSLEAAARTVSVQAQLMVSRSSNWMYEDLLKRYA